MIRRAERLHKRRTPSIFPAAAAHAGLKADDALDVALLVSTTSCATAGVFTRNALRAAPVIYDADLLSERPGRIRAVAMNARVANACTGAPGLEAARAMARSAEEAAGLPPRTALVRSEEHTSELQSRLHLVC